MISMASMLGICLSLAVTAAESPAPVFVPTERFTLAWTHSIEKVRWEEDYAVVNQQLTESPKLQALEARIQGSAAGMEPPPEAQLQKGWYRYQPPIWPETPLRLTRSEFTADFDLCVDVDADADLCQPLGNWLPSDGGVTLLRPSSSPESCAKF